MITEMFDSAFLSSLQTSLSVGLQAPVPSNVVAGWLDHLTFNAGSVPASQLLDTLKEVGNAQGIVPTLAQAQTLLTAVWVGR